MTSPGDIAAIADRIYAECEKQPQHLYEAEEFRSMDGRISSGTQLQNVINHLLAQGLFKIMMQGGGAVFKLVSKDTVSKYECYPTSCRERPLTNY